MPDPLPSQPVVSRLPINLEDLLRQRTVERDRIEYKAGWNPDENRLWFVAKLPIHKAFAVEAGNERPKSGPSQAQVEAQELSDIERRILVVLKRGPLATQAIAAALGHASLSGAAKLALARLESARLIELTIPDKPRSRMQLRRLTPAGTAALAAVEQES